MNLEAEWDRGAIEASVWEEETVGGTMVKHAAGL